MRRCRGCAAAPHALRDRAGDRPIALGVDDAQLLDPASAALVLHLATTGQVFVVATVRVGRAVSPTRSTCSGKDAGAQRLPLDALDDEAMQALVEAALGEALEEQALQLGARSQPRQPAVRARARARRDRPGQLALEHDLWQLAAQPTVSSSLLELVEWRMAALTAEQRAPIELLALGEPLRLSEITSLTSYDALSDAERHGLISIDERPPDAELRLSHPLYGDALRARLPPLRARALRLRLATALQSARRSRPTTRCGSSGCCWTRTRRSPRPCWSPRARGQRRRATLSSPRSSAELAVAEGGSVASRVAARARPRDHPALRGRRAGARRHEHEMSGHPHGRPLPRAAAPRAVLGARPRRRRARAAVARARMGRRGSTRRDQLLAAARSRRRRSRRRRGRARGGSLDPDARSARTSPAMLERRLSMLAVLRRARGPRRTRSPPARARRSRCAATATRSRSASAG